MATRDLWLHDTGPPAGAPGPGANEMRGSRRDLLVAKVPISELTDARNDGKTLQAFVDLAGDQLETREGAADAVHALWRRYEVEEQDAPFVHPLVQQYLRARCVEGSISVDRARAFKGVMKYFLRNLTHVAA